MTKLEMWLKDSTSGALPRLMDAKEAGAVVGMRPERLIELAEAGVVPHARIDGGPPVFYRPDLTHWVKEHLITVQQGTPLREILVVGRAPRSAEAAGIPDELFELRSRLKVHTPDPAVSCVYFLIANGIIVYVGSTVSIASRTQDHMKEKSFDRVLYLPVPEDHRLRIEYMFIAALKPELNQKGGKRQELSKSQEPKVQSVVTVEEALANSTKVRNGVKPVILDSPRDAGEAIAAIRERILPALEELKS